MVQVIGRVKVPYGVNCWLCPTSRVQVAGERVMLPGEVTWILPSVRAAGRVSSKVASARVRAGHPVYRLPARNRSAQSSPAPATAPVPAKLTVTAEADPGPRCGAALNW